MDLKKYLLINQV